MAHFVSGAGPNRCAAWPKSFRLASKIVSANVQNRVGERPKSFRLASKIVSVSVQFRFDKGRQTFQKSVGVPQERRGMVFRMSPNRFLYGSKSFFMRVQIVFHAGPNRFTTRPKKVFQTAPTRLQKSSKPLSSAGQIASATAANHFWGSRVPYLKVARFVSKRGQNRCTAWPKSFRLASKIVSISVQFRFGVGLASLVLLLLGGLLAGFGTRLPGQGCRRAWCIFGATEFLVFAFKINRFGGTSRWAWQVEVILSDFENESYRKNERF